MADGPQELPVPRAALIVLDGWGLADPGPGNAIELADTPVFDELWSRFPHDDAHRLRHGRGPARGSDGQLRGRPSQPRRGQRGHAGPHPDRRRRRGAASSPRNDALRDAFTARRRVHVIGLVSDGGVHSSMDHLRALIELGASLGVSDLVVHAFTDGRDTTPKSGAGFLDTVDGLDERERVRAVGSVVGRYYAMDRDKRWDRVKLAYDMLVHGRAEHHVDSAAEAARAAYERDETDEFIDAALVGRRPASGPATRSWASTSAPTACGRSRARWPSPALTSSTATAARRWSTTR